MNPIGQFWSPSGVRELDTTPLPTHERPLRIVACLNVWNDLEGLKKTLPTWINHVDHVIAVDGAYGSLKDGQSTDGTREYLAAMKKVTLLDGAGLMQCDKRTLYLTHGRKGDLLFIIDADEFVLNAAVLRGQNMCDVGWLRVQSSMYKRQYGQPRFIRWQPGLTYRGRHHWIYVNDRLLCTHQYGGPGFEHRTSDVIIENQRGLGRNKDRLAAKTTHHSVQLRAEVQQCSMPAALMSDSKIGGREALQIMHIAYRDDGLAPSRLHTAINRTTPHSSLFFKRRPGPFGVPDGYLTIPNAQKTTQAAMQADILHFHGVMSQVQRYRQNGSIVFHHHGSLLRANADQYNAKAKSLHALVLLSNLELFSWVDGEAHFLPNTMPVARYRRLREQFETPWDGNSPFRIAHSPSKPQRKGTDKFLAVCKRLNERGIPVEPVMMHEMLHHEVLTVKATCHAAFDSFWLGIQCSGLEAAAMGLPVIAGDVLVRNRYCEQFGNVPYTFAEDEEQLEDVIAQLIDDTEFYAQEATRVEQYVNTHHDESAVALRYLDLLDGAFSWRANIGKTPAPRTHLSARVAR